MPRKTGRLITAGIILFWLAMMAVLLYREVLLPALHTAPISERISRPQDLWMGIFVGDQQVGFLNLTTTPDLQETPGERLNLTLKMTLPLLGSPTDLLVTGSAHSSRERGIRSFDFVVHSGEHEMRLVGEVADNLLSATLKTGGEDIPLSFPVADELLLSSGTGLNSISVPLLEPGEVFYVNTFDPTTMSMGRAKVEGVMREEITVAGEEHNAFVVDTDMAGIESRAWLAADGEVLRAQTPFGFTLEKIPSTQASVPVQAQRVDSLIRTLAVQPSGIQPRRGAKRLVAALSGIEETAMPPEGALQRVEDNVVTVQAPEVPAPGTQLDSTLAEYLQSDPFVTAAHARIINQAMEIVGDETDPWQKALLIYQWTFNNIEKISIISVPNALEVLRTREGDCNEHTILFTALARAAGIPTQIAIGLVYSEDIGGFGYHAWPEVHIGEWIPMDPTLGQPLADATHIKVLTGGIEQWPRLVPYIGRLQLEVLEQDMS